MALSIVIPATDCLGEINRSDLDSLLADLEPHKDLFNEIIVCFDSCEWDFIKFFEDKYGQWLSMVVNDGKAFQFTKNANQGLKICHGLGDDVILINQDCKSVEHSSLRLLVELSKGGDLVSSASMESIGPWISWEPKFNPSNRFPFYCVYISKKCMDTIGYLDEIFIKIFSDDDYIVRALLAGLKCSTSNIPVYHRGSHLKGDFTLSASGCYTNNDLGLGLNQFKTKWQADCQHEEIAQYVLDSFIWDDRFKCM